jgi:dipeptidyl aminopeptidase/acylaminoacyl peptidase
MQQNTPTRRSIIAPTVNSARHLRARDDTGAGYHVYEGEGHGWRKTETIERFYESLDAFLRQYVVFA